MITMKTFRLSCQAISTASLGLHNSQHPKHAALLVEHRHKVPNYLAHDYKVSAPLLNTSTVNKRFIYSNSGSTGPNAIHRSRLTSCGYGKAVCYSSLSLMSRVADLSRDTSLNHVSIDGTLGVLPCPNCFHTLFYRMITSF